MSLNDFEVLSRIGDSSNSSVFKVRRIKDDGIYALKKVRLDKMTSKEVHHAVNQVRFLASIRHPNVITYKEAFYESQTRSLCIIMEYADGGDLLKKIFQYKRKGHHFTEEYVWDTFIQLLKGLNAIHELKITHRDLKSANIFLTKTGLVKIGNFDVSIVLGKEMMCETQIGTPYYASPQIWRDQSYNSKSDMWSLGCILYELLHLRPPFRARDVEGLSKKVNRGYFGKIANTYSQDFADILHFLLEIDPKERKSCKELLRHPIVKERMRKGKVIESLETSFLLKTIRPAKNMNYLTDRLPKPNYVPVRFRSFKQIGRNYENQSKFLTGSMQDLPKANSLFKSQTSSRDVSFSPKSNLRYSDMMNPQWLPMISAKRKAKLY